MSKLIFNLGLAIASTFLLVTISTKAQNTEPKEFLFTVESAPGFNPRSIAKQYRYLIFEVHSYERKRKKIYSARLKKGVVSSNYGWGAPISYSYYDSGEPTYNNTPNSSEIAARFLEKNTVRFTFENEKLVIENLDSLQSAFLTEINSFYPDPKKYPPHLNIKDFKISDILNYLRHIYIKFPDDIQNKGDMSLVDKAVYNYLNDVGPLQQVEITNIRGSKSMVLVPKSSPRIKYKRIGTFGGTVLRTFDLADKYTMQLEGTLRDQKNKTIDFQVEGFSRLDPAQKIQVKTDPNGNFSLFLEQDFPVTINASTGHQFYAEPGDFIQVSSNHSGDSLFFKGIGADNNEYLQKELKLEKFPKIDYSLREKAQSDWFKKIDKIANDYFVMLKNYSSVLSPRFYESKYLNYYYGKVNAKLDQIFSWVEYYSTNGPAPRKYEGLDTIPDQYQSFIFNRELNRYFGNKLMLQFEKTRGFTYLSNGSGNHKSYPTPIEKLQLAASGNSGKIFRDYMEFTAPGIYNSNKPDEIRALEEIVQQHFDNTHFQTRLKILRKDFYFFETGNLFPSVGFIDINRKEIYLSEHQGKVIYMMLWRNDALTLDKQWTEYQQLIKTMKDQKVLFVNVGLEVDFDNWKKYVETMKLDGLNLFIDRNSDDFRKYFQGLKSRHYMLIDSSGKIVNNNGPDPSVANVLISENMAPTYREEILLGILILFVTGALVTALVWLISRTRRNRKMKFEALLNRLRETELKAIKAQMNPHFLFNSLNSIQNLINQQNVELANQYLSKFARLLRAVLQHSEKEFIPLADELETMNLYIQLEKLRFNFDYQLEIDPRIDLYNTYMPPLLMQPFIENAILHGLQPKEGEKQLFISVHEKDSLIICKIIDNGAGRAAASLKIKDHHGMGNKLSLERIDLLNQKNKSNFKLTIDDGEPDAGGTQVTISFANNLM